MLQVKPVANNRGGSYLTMWSLSGIKFGILQVQQDHLMASYSTNISCQPIMPSHHALLLWVLADGSQGMLQQSSTNIFDEYDLATLMHLLALLCCMAICGLSVQQKIKCMLCISVVVVTQPVVMQVLSCWGIVFVDQAYWQSAIAARPSATWKGYILGGLM